MNGMVCFLAGAVATALVATPVGRRMSNGLGEIVSTEAKRRYEAVMAGITPKTETDADNGAEKEGSENV